MLGNKGNTLIESLLAFEIFISVFVIYISLFTQIINQEARVQRNYDSLLVKEENILYQGDYIETIELVLHS